MCKSPTSSKSAALGVAAAPQGFNARDQLLMEKGLAR